MRGLFTGEDSWCLLLSEPNAGSDLGNVSTRATRDGESWILNGQKVWTSLAHLAKFGLVLARHDPDAPKHKGLTAFIVDMQLPGIEVRPIRQMTGDAEFDEVFFTDVSIPDANRVGDLGLGWTVIMSALATERFIIGHDITLRNAGPIAEALHAWAAAGINDDQVARDDMARLWIEGEVIRLYSLRSLERYHAGMAGAESTMLKLRFTQFLQDVYEFVVDIMGPEGILYENDYDFVVFDDFAIDGHDPRRNFLATRSRTIGGGTSEILRTNIGERVLGLPREPR
jgi:alkylation response protein AidB-like acyl-CoA dehydrogenase